MCVGDPVVGRGERRGRRVRLKVRAILGLKLEPFHVALENSFTVSHVLVLWKQSHGMSERV